MLRSRLVTVTNLFLLATCLASFSNPASAESSATRSLYTAICGFDLNEQVASQALKNGADINWRNGAMNEESMLITAIKGQKDSKTIKFLLEHGADAALKDGSGKTALDYAKDYNLGKSADGREIMALLQAGENEADRESPHSAVSTSATTANLPASAPGGQSRGRNSAAHRPATATTNGGGVDPLKGAVQHGQGGPTPAEVKKSIEQFMTVAYQNHFAGVRNKVTFEWLAPIEVGSVDPASSATLRPYWPVKIQVKVTAEDPRDGNRSVVTRGINADYGWIKKREMFRFFKNGFGEWEYAMYEI